MATATAKGKAGARAHRITTRRGVRTTVWRNGVRPETFWSRLGLRIAGGSEPRPLRSAPTTAFGRMLGAIAGTYYEPPKQPVSERYEAWREQRNEPLTEATQAELFNRMRERRIADGRNPDDGRDADGFDEWGCVVGNDPYDANGRLKFGRKPRHVETGEEWSPEGFLANGDFAGKNGTGPGRNASGYDSRGFKGAPAFTFAGTGTPFTPDRSGRPGTGVNVDGLTRAEVAARGQELVHDPSLFDEHLRQAASLPNWR